MTDMKTQMSKSDEVAWNAMMERWREAHAHHSETLGRMPAASGMLFVALQALRTETGDEHLAKLLEALAGKVRAGEPITMKVKA